MLFESFDSLVRTMVVGVLAYAGLVLLLRISGRRTLSKMNSFDFVVTIALGSTLATVLLNKSVSLADGLIGFALLIGLQFAVTWTSVRVQWVQKIITGEPILLFYAGQYLPKSLRKARVTKNEIRAAVRSEGEAHLENIGAVILETDGSFSVIRTVADSAGTSFSGINTKELQEIIKRSEKPDECGPALVDPATSDGSDTANQTEKVFNEFQNLR